MVACKKGFFIKIPPGGKIGMIINARVALLKK